MTLVAHIASTTPTLIGALRVPKYFWTTLLVLSAIGACGIALSLHIDNLVFEPSLAGP